MFLKNLAVRMTFILILLGLTFNLVAALPKNNLPTDLQTLIQNTLAQEQSLVVNEQQKLIISGDPQAIQFGYAVDLDGNTAVVGTYANCPGCDRRGAAYVFVRSGDTWTLQAKLTAADAGPPSQVTYFGSAVAINGDTVLIGAPSTDNPPNRGSVYVFVRNGSTWTQQAKLLANDPDLYRWKQFGHSVALDGDTALIGTYAGDRAYVFVRNGTSWTKQATLAGSLVDPYSYFGHSVAVDGDTALVGTNSRGNNPHPPSEGGTAFVFVRNGTTWTEQARLTADDPDSRSNRFGAAVDLKGNTAVISAMSAGSVYIFERTGITWTQQTEILPSQYIVNAAFGYSVALDGDNLLVGSSSSFGSVGHVHLFHYANGIWTKQAEYVASDAQTYDRFGADLVLEGDIALVGADGDDPDGSVYVFKDAPGVITELLVNGDLEQDTNADLTPDGWERINITADVIKCGNKGVLQGLCMYHFKGVAGEDSYLKQDIQLQNFDLQAGDTITLDGYIDAKGEQIDTQARILVKYTDSNLPNINIYDRYFVANEGWTPLADTLTVTLAGEPRVVRVILQNNSVTGRVRFDAMSLKWQDNSGGAMNDSGLIPLPNAPDNHLESRMSK